jgi:hypothetical protein
LNTVTGFSKVCLAQKRGGGDDGTFYAVKTFDKDLIMKHHISKYVMGERAVFEKDTGLPFLVGLKYAFQTKLKLHFIMGEYIRVICMIVRIP